MTKTQALQLVGVVTLAHRTLHLDEPAMEYWASRLMRFDYETAMPRIQAFCDKHVGPPPSLGEVITAIRGTDLERQQRAQQALGQDFTGGQLEAATPDQERVRTFIAQARTLIGEPSQDPLTERFEQNTDPGKQALIEQRKRQVLIARQVRAERRRDKSEQRQLEAARRQVAEKRARQQKTAEKLEEHEERLRVLEGGL